MSATTKRRRHWPSKTGELRPQSESSRDPFEVASAAALAIDPKSLSLCSQARRALEYALGGECHDEALYGLEVIEVLPDPTVRRLRVWLASRERWDEEERLYVLSRLTAARGFLRAQIAQSIHRKRTPELVFELLAAEPDAPDSELQESKESER